MWRQSSYSFFKPCAGYCFGGLEASFSKCFDNITQNTPSLSMFVRRSTQTAVQNKQVELRIERFLCRRTADPRATTILAYLYDIPPVQHLQPNIKYSVLA